MMRVWQRGGASSVHRLQRNPWASAISRRNTCHGLKRWSGPSKTRSWTTEKYGNNLGSIATEITAHTNQFPLSDNSHGHTW